jgi:hypothetical protein
MPTTSPTVVPGSVPSRERTFWPSTNDTNSVADFNVLLVPLSGPRAGRTR